MPLNSDILVRNPKHRYPVLPIRFVMAGTHFYLKIGCTGCGETHEFSATEIDKLQENFNTACEEVRESLGHRPVPLGGEYLNGAKE